MNGIVAIESPCISVCQLDADRGYCRGCLRSLTEIANWGRYTPEQRCTIMAALLARKADEQQNPLARSAAAGPVS